MHIGTTVVDGYVHVTWIDALVPFVGSYHPLALGLGALAVDLLLTVIITSALRARISFASWRLVHWFAYACWPIAMLHGFLIGTDHHESWMVLIDLACTMLIVGLGVLRVFRPAARVDGRLRPIPAPVAPSSDRHLSGSRS